MFTLGACQIGRDFQVAGTRSRTFDYVCLFVVRLHAFLSWPAKGQPVYLRSRQLGFPGRGPKCAANIQ